MNKIKKISPAENILRIDELKQLLHLYDNGQYETVIKQGLTIKNRFKNPFWVYNLLGLSYLKNNEIKLAINIFNKLIKINPNYFEAYNNLGVCYFKIKENNLALLNFQKALKINKNYYTAYVNIGNIFKDQKKFESSLEYYMKAIKINSNCFEAFNNLGSLYQENDMNKLAEKYFKKTIIINHNYANAHYNLSLLYMHLGRFKEAWTDFHWRWHSNEFYSEAYKTNKPKFNLSSNYHHVFIWKEQGIGDQILFARLFNDLRDKDIKIDALVDKKLKPLFQSSFPHINFVDSANEDLIDSHAPMGDLGQFFINNFDDVKARSHPYIKVNQQRTETLKKLLPSDKKICGISWVSVNEDLGRNKSMSLEQLKDILLLPNMVFVDLQYGDTSQERQSFYEKYGVKILKIEEVDNFDDIEGLASLIDLCDCVLSVSNTTVHIAGAIGKPTYLMLPKGKGKLWYWSKEGNQSMWYKSIKIFEQDKIFRLFCKMRSLT